MLYPFETNPIHIADQSFQIIESLVDLSRFSENEKAVAKRIIHTTGDTEFAAITQLGNRAVEEGIAAIARACNIVTDVEMVASGINKSRLGFFNCPIHTSICHPDAAYIAESEGITRSMAGARLLKSFMNNAIILCGNAPTFLFEIMEMVKSGEIRPALIVGVPVGFVGAAESKSQLWELAYSVPVITCAGTKGGSAIAAAVLNALVLQANNNGNSNEQGNTNI